jgi:hypothetical protein
LSNAPYRSKERDAASSRADPPYDWDREDNMKRIVLVLLFSLSFALSCRANSILSSWNGGTGNWSVATNWEPAVVPNNGGGNTYYVKIDSGGVTLDQNASIASLVLGGTLQTFVSSSSAHTLDISRELTINGTIILSIRDIGWGGSLSASRIVNGGDIQDPLGFGYIVSSSTLINNGIINGTNLSAPIMINNGGIDLNLQDESSTHASANTFINRGYAVFGGSDTSLVTGNLVNYGTVEAGGNDSGGSSLFAVNTINYGTIFTDVFHGGSATFGPLINRGSISGIVSLSDNTTNSGTFEFDEDNFSNGTYLQTAGSTLVNGTLTETGGAIVIRGGTLTGGGQINGNVFMGGSIEPGFPPFLYSPFGSLTINGNYQQTGAGVYNELISQGTNGLLNISGNAILDPGASLDIDLLGGFDPTNGTSFTIMDYGSEAGQFHILDPNFNSGLQHWAINYNGGVGDKIVLTAEAGSAPAVPEPSTLLLFGTMLVSLAGYARKKSSA